MPAGREPNHDKTLLLAITHGNIATLQMAQQGRRLFGPLIGAGKKDVSPADDGRLGAPPSPDPEDHEECLVYRGAEKKLMQAPNRA